MISLILEKCPAMEKFRDILFDLRKKIMPRREKN
jgi:hypothetical protein